MQCSIWSTFKGRQPLHRVESWLIARRARSKWAAYAVAVVVTILVLITRMSLQPLMVGNASALLLFTIAVTVSSWYGGFLPGLASTLLSVIVGWFFILNPTYSFAIENFSDALRLVMFLVVGVIISYLNHLLDTVARRAAMTTRALAGSEERFRALVEGVADHAIITLDPEGRVASWNAGAQRILGYTHGEIVGREVAAFYPADDQQAGKPLRDLQQAARENHLEQERWLLRKDAVEIWANTVLTPLRNLAGDLRRYSLIVRDITERKRAAEERERLLSREREALEALWRSEARFSRLSQSNILGILFMNLSGAITEANDAFLDLVGHTREAVAAGKLNFRDLTPADYQSLDERAMREVKRGGSCIPYEKQCLRSDGRAVSVMVGIARLDFSTDNAIAFVLDVSEQRRARQAAQQREQVLGAVAASLRDAAFFTIDLEGKITTWNPGAQRFLGYLPHEVVGRHISMLYLLADTGQGAPIHDLERAALEGQYRTQGHRRRKDGTSVACEIVLTTLRPSDNVYQGFAVLFRESAETAALSLDHAAGI